MGDVWIVRSTFAKKDEAISAAKTLLEARLIACANITEPVTSLYHWEDMLQTESEVVLWLKTTNARAYDTVKRLKALNHYQIPSILAWPVAIADEDFSHWVGTEVV